MVKEKRYNPTSKKASTFPSKKTHFNYPDIGLVILYMLFKK